MDKIEIPLSKTKLLFGIGASFLCIAVGYSLFSEMAEHQTRYPPIFVKIIGLVCILTATITSIYGIVKIFDKKAGLTIDKQGIIDNTNFVSIGLIKWSEIIDIKTERVKSSEFLLIFIKEPNKVLEKFSGIKRKLMNWNMKRYGTPLSITSKTLKCNFNDLEKLLKDKLNEMPNRQ